MEITNITTSHPYYKFIEELYVSAFPEDERRPIDKQRWNVDHNENFHCYLLTETGNKPIGFITVWGFDEFYYAEHFAIDPSLRNGGYGSRVMQTLLKELHRPVVLEAEVPTEEMSCRRIRFYERQGFRVWDKDYLQPPYHLGGKSLPLYLLLANGGSISLNVDQVKETIYEKVYGVK